MKVYVDFDRTLFDCDHFLDDLYKIVNKYNVTKAMFKECQNQCKKKGFNPYNILDLVKKQFNFDDELYLEIKKIISKSRDYLYPDAISFLEYLNSLDYEVIILTKGNSLYQKEKISSANIDKLYRKLMVTMKHKGNLNLSYSESVFVDDNPIEIQSIIAKKPKMIIRVNRDNSKYSDGIVKGNITVVKSLAEIVNHKLLN